MKAAVLYPKDEFPQYADFPIPVANGDEELLITVKATAIKHLDRAIASGSHYSSNNKPQLARVIGGDGVGLLEDGTRVFAIGVSGMAAQKAIIEKSRMVKVPEGIDDAVAAALPNAVAGSAMALRFRAGITPGETVLVNGATGFTGKIAVQVAKHYGAKRIIATGRNEASLKALRALGADEVISLTQDDEHFIAQLKAIHQSTPIDIIIDYLWGHTAELILAALKGKGAFTHKVRYVTVGAVTGHNIQLSSEVLRSNDLQLLGSGLGSWTKNEMQELFSSIIPEMYQLASDNILKVETEKVKLEDIGSLWNIQVPPGKRLVVII